MPFSRTFWILSGLLHNQRNPKNKFHKFLNTQLETSESLFNRRHFTYRSDTAREVCSRAVIGSPHWPIETCPGFSALRELAIYSPAVSGRVSRWRMAAVGALLATGGMLLLKKFYFSGGKCLIEGRLDGKQALVTGANRGLGLELTAELARRGCNVIMACSDLDSAHKAKAQILEWSGEGQPGV